MLKIVFSFFTYLIAFVYAILIIVFLVVFHRKQTILFTIILLSFPVSFIVLFFFQWLFPNVILTGTSAVAALLIVYTYLQYRLLIIDDLTGLQYKDAFNLQLSIYIRDNEKIKVVFLSIVDFRLFVDRYGENISDSILIVLSKFFTGISIDNTTYRYGIAEFSWVFNEKESDVIESILPKITKGFEDYWEISGMHMRLDISVAVVGNPTEVNDVESIMALASFCIDQRKIDSNQEIIYATPEIVLKFERISEIIKELAVERPHKFCSVYFQPLYNINLNKFISAEALLRFYSPMLGNVSPLELIPILEEIGLISEIGEFVLEESCKFMNLLEEIIFI